MDAFKLTNIINKLKDYSALVVPIILTLVAVGIFIPAQLMSSSLKEKMEKESITDRAKKTKSLIQNAKPADQWKEEQKYQLAFESDANEVAKLAEMSTRRQLLSYKIFPEPNETSVLIFTEFSRNFCQGLDRLVERMNATDCPSEAEIQQSLQKSANRRKRGGGMPMLNMGRAGKIRGLSEVDETILDQLCREKAESAAVYANAFELSGYDFWENWAYDDSLKETVKDCWYWQLGYWIVEDVIDTVAAMNDGSNSVLTSPVKHLLSVDFDVTNTMRRTMGKNRKGRAGDNKKPSYVFDDGSIVSLTGRFSSEQAELGGQSSVDIDVVHFNVTVIVAAKAVLPFMKELCSAKKHVFKGFTGQDDEKISKHNQITILSSEINPVDMTEERYQFYRYGCDDAVVEMILTCEYVFNKKGYKEIKPESVNKPKVGL